LVVGIALLAGLAGLGPVQFRAGYSLHALSAAPHRVPHLENFGLNVAAFRLINGHPSPPLDLLFAVCWYLGNGLVLIPVLLILLAVRPGKVKYFLVAVALETALAQALKFHFDQVRPPAWLDQVRVLHPYWSHSFPSGDAALAWAVACVLLPGESRPWKVGLLVWAALIAVERVYVGVHHPLDVVVGALVGALAAGVAWRLPWWRKPAQKTQKSEA